MDSTVLQNDIIEDASQIQPANDPTLLVTVATKNQGILTKRAFKNAKGEVETDARECKMTGGHLTTERCTLQGLAHLLLSLKHDQALIHGYCGREEATIVLTTADDTYPDGSVPRNKKHFHYPDEPCLAMIDYDPLENEKEMFGP